LPLIKDSRELIWLTARANEEIKSCKYNNWYNASNENVIYDGNKQKLNFSKENVHVTFQKRNWTIWMPVFWGVFTKLCKTNIRLIISTFRMEQLRSHSGEGREEGRGRGGGDFRKILYLWVLRKYVDKIRVSLKSDKNYGYFTWKPGYIYDNT
jgi:hypothetical protein